LKRLVCIAMILLLVGGCFLTGDKGDTGLTGSSGSSGVDGAPGEDAVISTHSYEFTPVGNPYQHSIPEIVLADVESGKQTVDMYTLWKTGEWYPLPHSFEVAGAHYEDIATVGHQFTKFETLKDGANAGGDANLGSTTRVIVKIFNK